MMKKDKNAMKIITEAVIQSISMKTDQMMAVKITIREDMLRLITEKKDVKETNIMKEITKEIIVTMKENLDEMKIIKGE